MNWCCPNLHSVLFIISAFILALKYTNCSESECYFNKPSTTPKPSINEYGCYRTLKNKCAILRKDAKIFPIQTCEEPEVGELKLFYPPNIILNEPYKQRRVYKYNVSCPEGFLAYFRLLSLDLDPNSDGDYLEVHGSSGWLKKYSRDLTTVFCTEFVAADITHLLFRSDKHATNNGLGFIAYMVCFRPEDANLTGCTNSDDTDPGSTRDTADPVCTCKKRDTADVTVVPSNYVPQDDDRETLDDLIRAAFDVSIMNTNKHFCDEDLEITLCHVKACNPVLRATARAIVSYTKKLQPGRIEAINKSKHATPIAPSLRPPLSIYDDDDECVDISQIPFCSNLNYSKAHFPNYRGHDSPAEANNELCDFIPLVNNGCSNAIVHLLCSVYAPFCYVDGNQETSKLHPCIELCRPVREGCESVMNSKGLKWPPHLDCNNSDIYKPNNSELTYCPKNLSTLVIPSIPAKTTNSDVPPTYYTGPTYEEPTTHYVDYVEPALCVCKSTDLIPLCSSVSYSQAYQNFRGLSIIETNIELSSYQSLIDTSCSDYLINLLCSVYAPPCNGTDPVIKLRPCRALCRKVKDDCRSNLDIYDNLPELFDCENDTVLYQNDDELSYCPPALFHESGESGESGDKEDKDKTTTQM